MSNVPRSTPPRSAVMNRRMIRKIERVTGMAYCGLDCNCPERPPAYLLFWPSCLPMPEWLPGWTNGTDPDEVYDWLQEAAMDSTAIRDAMREAGMRINWRA